MRRISFNEANRIPELGDQPLPLLQAATHPGHLASLARCSLGEEASPSPLQDRYRPAYHRSPLDSPGLSFLIHKTGL